MLNSLNYKKKLFYLIVIIFILIVFSYNYSIKKTTNLYFENKDLKSKLKENEKLLEIKSKILNELNFYNKKVNINIDSNVEFREKLFNVITLLSQNNKVKIIEFNKPKIYNNDELKFEYSNIIIEGDFKKLLLLLNQFERKRIGKIISLSFYVSENYNLGLKKLNLSIYVQNIY